MPGRQRIADQVTLDHIDPGPLGLACEPPAQRCQRLGTPARQTHGGEVDKLGGQLGVARRPLDRAESVRDMAAQGTAVLQRHLDRGFVLAVTGIGLRRDAAAQGGDRGIPHHRIAEMANADSALAERDGDPVIDAEGPFERICRLAAAAQFEAERIDGQPHRSDRRRIRHRVVGEFECRGDRGMGDDA